MGQCFSRTTATTSKDEAKRRAKQDKNIDDKRMFKLGVDVLNRDFCIQIGYNRKAVKTYGNPGGEEASIAQRSPLSEANEVS